MLICPKCQIPLNKKEQTWRCDNNHVFDVGRNGDVNLLLPQHKRSRFPGDSKEMVNARRDFLASGAYQPIAESLAKYVMMISRPMPVTIADAGCGDGYYLRQIKRLCYPQTNSDTRLVGWDISKFAVQSASKQSDFGLWLTASNAQIPLADNSVDIGLSLFGFEVASEFSRILSKSGYFITVDTGENHLIELRRLIYPEIKPYRAKSTINEHYFQCIRQESLHYQVTLEQTQLAQLLKMTPHFFRTKAERAAAVFALTELSVTIDVFFRIYKAM